MCRAPFHTCVECNDCVISENSHTKWPHINIQFGYFGAFALAQAPTERRIPPAFYSIFTHRNAIRDAYAHHSTLNTTEIMTDEHKKKKTDEFHLFSFL